MGVDQTATLVAGVDAEDSFAAGGRSLVQRLVEGEFGPYWENPKLTPRDAVEERFSGGDTQRLTAFLAGNEYEDGTSRLIVGVPLLAVDLGVGELLAGPLGMRDLEAALQACRDAFQELAVPVEPRIWLVGAIT